MVLPVIAAAVLPALLPELARAVPWLVREITGSDATAETAGAVAEAVRDVAGAAEPEALREALADPDKAGALMARLAEIKAGAEAAREQAATERLRLALEDTANARAMAGGGSAPLMWGSLAVSGTVLALFAFAVVGSAFGLGVSEGLTKLLEYGLVAVLSFWVGSSAGSAAKSGLFGGPFGPGQGAGR